MKTVTITWRPLTGWPANRLRTPQWQREDAKFRGVSMVSTTEQDAGGGFRWVPGKRTPLSRTLKDLDRELSAIGAGEQCRRYKCGVPRAPAERGAAVTWQAWVSAFCFGLAAGLAYALVFIVRLSRRNFALEEQARALRYAVTYHKQVRAALEDNARRCVAERDRYATHGVRTMTVTDLLIEARLK